MLLMKYSPMISRRIIIYDFPELQYHVSLLQYETQFRADITLTLFTLLPPPPTSYTTQGCL